MNQGAMQKGGFRVSGAKRCGGAGPGEALLRSCRGGMRAGGLAAPIPEVSGARTLALGLCAQHPLRRAVCCSRQAWLLYMLQDRARDKGPPSTGRVPAGAEAL